MITENIRLGYACINMTLQKRKEKITCNRGMIKRTFLKKGINYASELALKNCKDLEPIIRWNHQKGIKVFRMTSCLFPWASEYKLSELPDYEEICKALKTAGDLAKSYDQRLSFHPGPFNILSSPKEHVVRNSYIDLEVHGQIMDLMGMPRNHYAKINIHVGAAYGDRDASIERFVKNFNGLSEAVRSRLTVENDDRKNLYSTVDLYEGVYKKAGIPIVFDFHHHKFCNRQELSEQEALEMAMSTWGDIVPCTHYSESKRNKEGHEVVENAHSDYIYDKINDYGNKIDIVVEAKAKELALIKYCEDHLSNAA